MLDWHEAFIFMMFKIDVFSIWLPDMIGSVYGFQDHVNGIDVLFIVHDRNPE